MSRTAECLRQGVAHLQAGRLRQAALAFEQLVVDDPRHLEGWCRLAAAREALGDHPGAIAAYRAASALKPDFAGVHCNLGAALLRTGAAEAAMSAFEQALAHQPDFPEALNGLGVALKALGRAADAVAPLRRAVEVRPSYAEAHYNLGNVLQAQEAWAEAIAAYRHALTLQPRSADLLHNLASALCSTRAFSEAADREREALALAPHLAEAHNGLGNALLGLGRWDEAAAAFTRATALKRPYPEALCNLGNTHLAQNDPAQALACYRQAKAQDATFAEAHFNEALALLLRGDLAAGFAGYEWRWQTEQKRHRRSFDSPRWTGKESLDGRTLLVHCEQGMGDTLQFVRYVPLLTARGAQVILEVQPALVGLLNSFPSTTVIARRETPPPHDFHVPLLSLPAAFATTLESIPATVPYLRIPELRRPAWADRLRGTARPRIGVVCSGNARHKNDAQRSVPLAFFESIAEAVGTPLHLVQKDLRPSDAAHLAASGNLIDWSPDLHDFSDTAALLGELDLLISVDTSVAHLAGALGRPVWLLLPYAPDWRWLLHRNDSPWYPTARLFRQQAPGDWQTVVEQTAEAIRDL